MKFLQKLGKALMLPVAVLPICGILMGIGYRLCPATMQGGEISGVVNLIGLFLVKAGAALIDNMAILFAIGVGVGMSEKNDGTGGIAALASWLMITTLLSTGVVTTIIPSIAESATKTLAFDKIENPFIGILAGIIGSACYNRFKDTKLPDWLSFFSGKRCVAIVSGVVSIVVSAVLLLVWPLLFGALVAIGKSIVTLHSETQAVPESYLSIWCKKRKQPQCTACFPKTSFSARPAKSATRCSVPETEHHRKAAEPQEQ